MACLLHAPIIILGEEKKSSSAKVTFYNKLSARESLTTKQTTYSASIFHNGVTSGLVAEAQKARDGTPKADNRVHDTVKHRAPLWEDKLQPYLINMCCQIGLLKSDSEQ